MTNINFYHLTKTKIEVALPKLLEKIINKNLRTLVLGKHLDRMIWLDDILWTYDPNSFLPHSFENNENSKFQPIFLTCEENNVNNASVLILIDNVFPKFIKSFDTCLNVFDGLDSDSLSKARENWKLSKSNGYNISYWKQKEKGSWELVD